MDRVLQDKINRMIGYLKVYPDVCLTAAEEKFQAHEDKVENVTSMTREEHEAEFSKSIYAKIVKVSIIRSNCFKRCNVWSKEFWPN